MSANVAWVERILGGMRFRAEPQDAIHGSNFPNDLESAMSTADASFWAAVRALDKHPHDLRSGLYTAYLAISKVRAEQDLPKPMQAEFNEMMRVMTCKPKGGKSAALDTIEAMSIADLERMDRRLRSFATRLGASNH